MSRYRDEPPLDECRIPDVRDAEWYRAVAEISDLLTDGTHGWAAPILEPLREQIERSHHVADWQRRTIAKIAASEWSPARSYDQWGFGRRWR